MSKPVAKEDLANSRYTDLVAEPVARLLSPIKGYESAPLLPLEEAVAPIAHFFDCIDENVWIAKENTKGQLVDELTHDEAAAIHLYTMQFDSDPSFYQLLNSTLRGENRDNLKPWFSYLKLFLTALHKVPSQPQTIWRGVRGVDLSKSYPTGTKFAWWGVSSCTNSVDVLQAETFLGKTGMRTLFSVESKNGKSIAPYSYFKDTEKEIVMMPGSYFEVIGQLNPADDLFIIQMKELDPPFPFVKPPFKREQQVTTTPKPSNASTSTPASAKVEAQAVPEQREESVQSMNPMQSTQSTLPMQSMFPMQSTLPMQSMFPMQSMTGFNFNTNPFGTTMTMPQSMQPPIQQVTPTPAPQPTSASASKQSKARVICSSLSAQMQEAAINIIREGIAEGTDEDDIKLIITSELIQRYGGNWWVSISDTPLNYSMMVGKQYLSVKIDKTCVGILQQ